jgi:thiol:disulfide interchange protein
MGSINRFIPLALISASAVAAQLQLSGLATGARPAPEPVRITIEREKTGVADTVFLALTFAMERHIHLYAAESLFFKVAVDSQSGLGKTAVILPEPHRFTNFDSTTVGVYTNGQRVRIASPVRGADWRLAGSVHFQACDTAMCFTPRTIRFSAASDGTLSAGDTALDAKTVSSASGPPDLLRQLDGFSVAGTRGGYLNAGRFSEFLRSPAGAEKGATGGFENRGIVVVILLILLGGIALNLTPCVLPMVPITLAVLGAGTQAKSRGRGMFTGGVYGLAMALTYGLLGMFVVLTGTRFGVINASPLFNIMIAVIFIFMALAMFDIVQVDFTRFRKSGAPAGERGKLLTVFLMGVVASLLAGACVAPVVI